ncbi:EAL and HDOD domain-containing protein [Thermocrinis jamiesonii]|uniref:EAL and HDOD domain-containing protein n=1 Tax=Thermocrinis jamiesonii TaxID=1302351 RepID=UPI000496229B|nr:HDOD domain-containing protein [Thermocrinis jamiesonii]
MSFLIAKQPIFDKKDNVVAYEVYLRKKGNMLEYPKEVPYNRSTHIILEILMEHGVNKIGEGKKIMLNVSIDSLLNKAFENLPPEKLILELIPPQIQVGTIVINQALKRAEKFKESGILLAASYDILLKESYQQFVEEAFLITVDFHHLTDTKVTSLKAKDKKLLITKIENEKQYNKAVEIGDFFEGNYLGAPYVLKEFETAPYLKNNLVKLIPMLHSAQSIKEIARFISYDAGLTAKLLRFVNSAYFSPIQEIKSVEQACSMLGMKNIRNFIFLLAMNDYISVENPVLWKKALIRAFLASQMAKRIMPDLEDAAYLMGLFSLIDEILGVDKISFLKEIHIDRVILDGYTGKHKKLREILDFASQLEEKYPTIQSSEDPYNSAILTNIEKITGINRLELLQMTKGAYEKAEQILNL